MSASSAYTSVPPCTGSPSSGGACSPGNVSRVGASVVLVSAVVSSVVSAVVVSAESPSVVVVSSAASVPGVEPVATVPGVVVALLVSSSSPHDATATSAITESAASTFVLRDVECTFPPVQPPNAQIRRVWAPSVATGCPGVALHLAAHPRFLVMAPSFVACPTGARRKVVVCGVPLPSSPFHGLVQRVGGEQGAEVDLTGAFGVEEGDGLRQPS